MNSLTTALFVVALAASPTIAVESDRSTDKPCRESPAVIGRCFAIHGRMNFWNGTPSVRIWKVGSHRILGVSDRKVEGYSNIPDGPLQQLGWDTDLFADFLVCPFTSDQPGTMQLVCVDSASKVLIRPRQKGNNGLDNPPLEPTGHKPAGG